MDLLPGEDTRTVADLLARSRVRHVVGRRAELDLFDSALADDEFLLLHVSGPGGIGKSTLLDLYAQVARRAGRRPVRLDGHSLPAVPPAVLEALGAEVSVPPGDGPIDAGPDRLVLLVDGYEELETLDSWFRAELLPRLPSSSVVVLAGRTAPRAEWRADPAWAERLRVITLRNLASADARAYLDLRGLPVDRQPQVVTATYGHPLALSLLADVLIREPDLQVAELPRDLVRALLRRLVDAAPSPAHQEALEVAAIARTTSEELLRHVLRDPTAAPATFSWLEDLSCVVVRGDGLAPHGLVRDLLDADLRRRDPESYRRVFRAVQEHVLAQIRATAGREQLRAIADLKFCFRRLRGVAAPVAWEDWGHYHPDLSAPEDHAAVVELVRAAEGDTSADLARHWLVRQPERFHVVRGPARSLRGVIALLDLTAASPEDRRADPVVSATWEHVVRTAPPRPGEVVTQCRFVVDAETYQDPSPTLNAVPLLTLQAQLATPGLAWDFVTLAEPDRWTEFFRAADMERATGADAEVGGRRFGSFGHDFRRVPVETMVRRWTERALADDAFMVPPPVEPELLVLAHADFAAAVRQGLRDLHRPDLLARNALLRTRLLAEPGPSGEPGAQGAAPGGPGPQQLADLLRGAVGVLLEDPRDDKLFRAVDRTYVASSRTQESAAALLGLPSSTYRRHLRQGTDRVVAELWQRELGRGTARTGEHTGEHR